MEFASPVWLALIAALLLAAVLMERVPVPGRALGLFKALFPSWRFFEDVGPTPRLWHRVRRPAESPADDTSEAGFTDTLPVAPRGLSALVWNPAGNLRFACGSLLDQLVAEIADLPDPVTIEAVEALTAYRVLLRLVRARADAPGLPPGAEIQLRIALDETGEEILRSPWYPAVDDGRPAGQEGLGP